MPLLLLVGGTALAAIFATATGAGVVNSTEPTKPSDGGIDAWGVFKLPLMIAGTVLLVKYGSKYIKKI